MTTILLLPSRCNSRCDGQPIQAESGSYTFPEPPRPGFFRCNNANHQLLYNCECYKKLTRQKKICKNCYFRYTATENAANHWSMCCWKIIQCQFCSKQVARHCLFLHWASKQCSQVKRCSKCWDLLYCESKIEWLVHAEECESRQSKQLVPCNAIPKIAFRAFGDDLQLKYDQSVYVSANSSESDRAQLLPCPTVNQSRSILLVASHQAYIDQVLDKLNMLPELIAIVSEYMRIQITMEYDIESYMHYCGGWNITVPYYVNSIFATYFHFRTRIIPQQWTPLIPRHLNCF